MTTNPFDDENASFVVLINARETQCLWPSFAPVPEGWHQVHGPTDRESCLDRIRHGRVPGPAAEAAASIRPSLPVRE